MKNIMKCLDFCIYWAIVLLPFFIAIAPAPMNVFMGFLVAAFLIKKILKKENLFTKTAINIPLLLFFLITCLSIFNSINLKDSFKGGIARLINYAFIFFVIVEEVKDQKHIRRIIFAMVFGLILVSLDAIWQVITGYDFIRRYEPIINIGLIRATASFKDANTFGIYLSATAPVIFGLTIYYLKGIKKITFTFINFIVLTGIALTYSRPTLLAIYMALFFLGITRKNKILIIILVIFTIAVPFILPGSVKKWAKDVEYNPLRFMCNDDRIAIYRNSLNMIRHHPVIGVGVNTFMKNYKNYKESPEYRNVITSDYLYAHNNFLHLAAEIGLVGLSIFLWLIYRLFRECMSIYKRLDDSYPKIISLCLSAGLIAFLINGLTESSLYSSRVAMIFWYIAGFALALKKFAHANR